VEGTAAVRVLVVEDEATVADNLKKRLERGGFTVDVARDGAEASYRGETEDYAAIILDLGLPQIDGLSLLKSWRRAGRDVPVIVLTARGSWMERVEGIDAGADDYLPKPFQMEELMARLHAVLRRSAGQSKNETVIGSLCVDPRRRSVSIDGEPVDLTSLEFRLLTCFVQRPDSVITASELLDDIYGHDHDKEINTVEALLGRLRRKIGRDLIGTRRGVGYYLKASE
jgi:DNA-binding response OmpR family regulator